MKKAIPSATFIALVLMHATGAASVPAPPPPVMSEQAAAACALARLKPFVGPYGIQQRWPVMTALPQGRRHAAGVMLSDTGPVADGYQHFLHVDVQTNAVYIVQQGGFAGTTKVYGPLPLPYCKPGPAPTSKPASPH
ncbi:hypothetical protein LJR168_000171 [Pseudoxanthomonas sp. LjRoot168]|uniref:hypothetical protein n=1 Tax=unclassified Pseudoxanthomonas TaxID=2645906 RepID=UPI003ECFD46E